MLSKYVWFISVEKISFIWSCDVEEIKGTNCIIKVHITSGNIKWRSFALRFHASNQKAHDNLCFPLRRAYLLLYVFYIMQESRWSSPFPFVFYPLASTLCWKDPDIYIYIYIYIYPIGCKLSWTIIVDITPEVKGWEANL